MMLKILRSGYPHTLPHRGNTRVDEIVFARKELVAIWSFAWIPDFGRFWPALSRTRLRPKPPSIGAHAPVTPTRLIHNCRPTATSPLPVTTFGRSSQTPRSRE